MNGILKSRQCSTTPHLDEDHMDPYLMVGLPYGLFLKVYASLKSLNHDQGSQHKSEIDTEIVSELLSEDMLQLCLLCPTLPVNLISLCTSV